VDKGRAGPNRLPAEIMGFIFGKFEGDTFYVFDAVPLPVEGTETRVVAVDPEIVEYQVAIVEIMSRVRSDHLVGWYHSHPFDVEVHSHCFLSSTDVSTQLQWQRAEDPHGTLLPKLVLSK
jgi:COP9 signalosome complex subunit 5